MEEIRCKACGQSGTGKFCTSCGETLLVKRITVSGLLHEVFHFFTHLDKRFGYTLKQLVRRPGHMQRDYLEGNRKRHQKPFSFFFIIATITGLSLYWINIILQKLYGAGNMAEAGFFNKYMIFLLVFSAPYFALITWLFFNKSGYNYAEIGMVVLYCSAMIFLIVVVANMSKFIWHSFNTRWIEAPAILVYTVITNVNFFSSHKTWVVILKTIVCVAIFFITATTLQDWFVAKYIK